jgi:transcriptional regulator with XRE-family HTH domain
VRPTEAGVPGLADRLNELFRTVPRPGSTELWNNETAAVEISRSGPSVSAAYLSQLRTGKRLNPSARHLAALAGMFGVPMEYFFPLSTLSTPSTPSTPGGGTRAADATAAVAGRLAVLLDGVSPAGLDSIEEAILQVRAAEHVPPVAVTSPDSTSAPTSGNGA